LHLVGILFPHINDDAGQNHIKLGFSCFAITSIVHPEFCLSIRVQPVRLRPSSTPI